ncbi:flavodoxin domain-containing protein [Roseovarius aestuariivivens]|uniref:flavodoxin domain-containing protein n=1 Tax=Roseovarius aestuariivivens TaxID=1888910 RepID=UPI00107FFE37|nr:flavodoxin domain-containing protein [Roseovarius aestuariivivens]
MTFLIAYATTEGQTRRICRFCADHLTGRGHSVELLDVDAADGLDPGRYEAAILAASVHLGRYQPQMHSFAAAHGAALSARPALFLAVSLAAAGDDPDELADLDRIAQTFCAETGFSPDRTLQVAGAFRFTEYDFFKGWAMRYIASVKGQKIDPHTDTEFTDWDALQQALDAWLEGIGARA